MATEMQRVLTVVDVTSLAIGQMIGAGIYVLTGKGDISRGKKTITGNDQIKKIFGCMQWTL